MDELIHSLLAHARTHALRYGGLLGGDGCIYGIPQNAGSVIKIDPRTDACSTIGSLEEGGWKWHGGNTAGDGNIYAIPCHADSVLKIDCSAAAVAAGAQVSTIGAGKVPAGRARPDGKYKYLGGVLGPDGCVYAMPSDVSSPKKESLEINKSPNMDGFHICAVRLI